MGKHNEKNDDQEKITSEGYFPDRKIPPPDRGGKHGKPDEGKEEGKGKDQDKK